MSEQWQGVNIADAWKPYRPDDERPWNERRAAHLFRRACFGGTAGEIEAAVGQEPSDVVSKIVDESLAESNEDTSFDFLEKRIRAGGDTGRLGSLWVYRLLFTKRPLLERLTLFWHGHFATGAEKVENVDAMLNQNELLREHALGSFRTLAKRVSKDPAMLIYLDSVTNRKRHPNENFARELMELFCLGEGNYTEQDVLELARCFTGWEIRRDKFRFNKYQHDRGEKDVLGRRSTFEDDTVVDWVVDQPACATFLVTKLFRYLISDEPQPSPQLVEPLANMLRENDYVIEPVVRTMLSSRLFFDDAVIGRKIRSPVDYVIGLMRSMQASGNAQMIADGLAQMGQGLFFPPNVKGWDGGRTWITSGSVLSRANFVQRLLSDEKTQFNQKSWNEYLAENSENSLAAFVQRRAQQLFATPLNQETIDLVRDSVEDGANLEAQTRAALRAMTLLPQFQLG